MAIAAGVRKLLQELRKGKARPLSKGASSGTACVGRGKHVLGARLLNTCRHRLGNAVNSKGADSIKLFRLVKTSASCKDCWKTKQHTVGGIKKADYVQHR